MINNPELPEDIELSFIKLRELNADDLGVARKVIEDSENQFSSSSGSQAEGMAETVGIDLQPEEVLLYAALREQMAPSAHGDWAKEKEAAGVEDTTTHASTMSDQELLAAVLRESGDDERLKKFVAYFPNIFK